MDYSEKINTHINAIRHYILAEADSTDPFVTDKEKYDAMGEIMNSRASRVSHVFNDRGFSTGFSGFLDRFVPAFVFGPESEQYEMSGIFFPFFDFFVVSSESDAYRHRLSVLADGKLLEKLEDSVKEGGVLVSSFKSFVADEYFTVYADKQPHRLHDCFGMSYNQFTEPGKTKILGRPAKYFAELLKEIEKQYPDIYNSTMTLKKVIYVPNRIVNLIK